LICHCHLTKAALPVQHYPERREHGRRTVNSPILRQWTCAGNRPFVPSAALSRCSYGLERSLSPLSHVVTGRCDHLHEAVRSGA
jgi:hypothetical protein